MQNSSHRYDRCPTALYLRRLQITCMENNEISRVVLRNYKSIRECDVHLGPITFLVGANGAGKSNFVEALRFLSYGLSSSLEQALDNRSGFRSIVHRGSDRASAIF